MAPISRSCTKKSCTTLHQLSDRFSLAWRFFRRRLGDHLLIYFQTVARKTWKILQNDCHFATFDKIITWCSIPPWKILHFHPRETQFYPKLDRKRLCKVVEKACRGTAHQGITKPRSFVETRWWCSQTRVSVRNLSWGHDQRVCTEKRCRSRKW